MSANRPIVVVMGVSGSGKTAIGRALAERLGVQFLEGDDLHPPANVAKMARGEALDDSDRAPWLAAIHRWLTGRGGEGGVVACSALKREYRATLARGVRPALRVVMLDPPVALLRRRLDRRTGHFMPTSLLASQLETLEPPEDAEASLTLANDGSEEETIDAIVRRLDRSPDDADATGSSA